MEKLVIHGGNPLKGEVEISGAKNAIVAIIPATVLAQSKCVIENVPAISDVGHLFEIIRYLGGTVNRINKTTYEIDTTNITDPVVPYELTKKTRASYYFLGSLLGRFSKASVAMPGGCNFGVRPIDQHIKGFEAMGAEVSIDSGMINAQAKEMEASHIYFDVVSVGATVNAMLAAVKTKGITVMENVAKEPHIVDLANFLNSMGADVRGAGTDVIKIHGVDIMHSTNYTIIPDQIEAGTYMAIAAATGADVLIKNVIPKHLEAITDKIVAAGALVKEYDDSIRVSRGTYPLKKINIKTMPHPGFPTDMQPQMVAMLSCAEGASIVTEGVWDNRFKYVDELIKMGASIQVDGKVAVVQGVKNLTGAPVRAMDLRAGAALVIAGLMAHGETVIEDIHHIVRGYDDIVNKLTNLGADIKKITVPEEFAAKAQ